MPFRTVTICLCQMSEIKQPLNIITHSLSRNTAPRQKKTFGSDSICSHLPGPPKPIPNLQVIQIPWISVPPVLSQFVLSRSSEQVEIWIRNFLASVWSTLRVRKKNFSLPNLQILIDFEARTHAYYSENFIMQTRNGVYKQSPFVNCLNRRLPEIPLKELLVRNCNCICFV